MIAVAKIFTFVLISLFVSYPAFGDEACREFVNRERQTTIEQYIRSADSVAVYLVVDAHPLDGGEYYSYDLNLHFPISGSGDSHRTVIGRPPLRFPPEHYFGALRRYDDLTRAGSTSFGSSVWMEREGACFVAPQFVLGYTYLVVDSSSDSVSDFEPVLDIVNNGWVNLVMAILSEER